MLKVDLSETKLPEPKNVFIDLENTFLNTTVPKPEPLAGWGGAEVPQELCGLSTRAEHEEFRDAEGS